MPVGPSPRNGRAEYALGPRIAGALFFDIDDIGPPPGSPANPAKLPHMKPLAETFARAMDRMGIFPDDTLYVYATKGCSMYHRAYWTLSSCGYHDPAKVKLVQGSLDEWAEEGGELEHGEIEEGVGRLFRMDHANSEGEGASYACWKDGGHDYAVVDMERVLTVVEGYLRGSEAGAADDDAVIVDARSSGRFRGTDPEPRPGLRGGRMPGAVNVPFFDLLDPDDWTKFRPMEEVREALVRAGVAPLEERGSRRRKVICSCGSGVTAAALAVGLEECGLRSKEDISIYDGSWIDWGGDDSTPIITGD